MYTGLQHPFFYVWVPLRHLVHEGAMDSDDGEGPIRTTTPVVQTISHQLGVMSLALDSAHDTCNAITLPGHKVRLQDLSSG